MAPIRPPSYAFLINLPPSPHPAAQRLGPTPIVRCCLHDDLKASIRLFLAGGNSISHANTIEGLIVSSFPDDHPSQETAEMLAQYAPGGGPYLYDERQVSAQLQELLDSL